MKVKKQSVPNNALDAIYMTEDSHREYLGSTSALKKSNRIQVDQINTYGQYDVEERKIPRR
jgi:hypothetical protein